MPRYKASQTPTFEQARGFTSETPTDGEKACRLASAYFDEPMPWQRHVIDLLMARDEHDKYLFHSFGMSVPRQNGKSWIVRARCFYGALIDGERILYTCQHNDTADEMFEKLSAPFEDEESYPELAQYLVAVRKANGQQAIRLKNGGLIRFTTRTNSLGRGRSYDVLIYDEAQCLTRAQQAAATSTTSANKRKNMQMVFLGTPPDPTDNGFVFEKMHDAVHAGKKRKVCWVEWSADKIHSTDERREWYKVNPSLGSLVDLVAVEAEADTMDEATFARERLGWWAPHIEETAEPAIPRDAWKASAISEIARKYQGVRAFGVKFSPDGQRYEVVGCKLKRDKSRGAVERVMSGTTERGTRELAEWLAPRAATASVVVIDGVNGPNALCENLRLLNVPNGYVVRPSARDVVTAAQTFVDSLTDGTCAHVRDKVMDENAKAATKRIVGRQGGWGFGDSICIEAASLALWGARATKRDPSRKQMILR